MLTNTCAVCEAAAPEDLWSSGWICVIADGTVVSREDASGVPAQVVVPPRVGPCLVCGQICLNLLVWREEYRGGDEVPAPF